MPAALAAGYVVHVLWRLWLARDWTVPAAHADEDGYLLIARALAGGAGGYTYENGPFFRVGYPLLLAPIYAGGGDAFEIYQRALGYGAFIGALLVPMAYLFGQRVLGLPVRWALAGAMTAPTLPAAAFYAGTALTDVVLPVLAMAWLVLLHGWLADHAHPARPGRAGWVYAAGAGAVAGLTYTMHVRGTMVLIVHCVVAAGVLIARRQPWRPAVVTVAVGILFAGIDPLCRWLLGDSVILLGNNPRSQITTALFADWRVALILLRVLGQAWYLAIGTLGLGLVGLLAVLHPLVSGVERRRELAAPGGLARLLTTLALLGTSVLVTAGSATSLPFGEHRITYFVYPRYLHFLFPVWLLIGVAALRAAVPRRRLVLAAGAGAGFLATGLIVNWRTAQEPGYHYIAFDVPELVALSGQAERFTMLAPTAVALGGFAGLVALLSWRRTALVALPVVAALGLAAAPVAREEVLRPMVEVQYRPDTPLLVRDAGLGPGDVVAEAYQVAFPFPFNHAREVSWHRLILFDFNQPPPPEANVIIAPWLPSTPPWNGMRLVAVDRYHGWAVWRRAAPEVGVSGRR